MREMSPNLKNRKIKYNRLISYAPTNAKRVERQEKEENKLKRDGDGTLIITSRLFLHVQAVAEREFF